MVCLNLLERSPIDQPTQVPFWAISPQNSPKRGCIEQYPLKYNHINGIYNHINELYDHINGIYNHINDIYNHINGIYNHINELYDHINGIYNHINDIYNHINGIYNHINELYDHINDIYNHINDIYNHINGIYNRICKIVNCIRLKYGCIWARIHCTGCPINCLRRLSGCICAFRPRIPGPHQHQLFALHRKTRKNKSTSTSTNQLRRFQQGSCRTVFSQTGQFGHFTEIVVSNPDKLKTKKMSHYE